MGRQPAIIVTILLVLSFLAAACGKEPGKEIGKETGKETGSETAVGEEKSSPSRFDSANGVSLTENESFIIGKSSSGSFLHYYDKTADTGGFLCGDPACLHQDWTCQAYVGNGNVSIRLNEQQGALYWIGYDAAYRNVKGAEKHFGVWTMKLNGSGRRFVRDLEEFTYGTNPTAVFRENSIFLTRQLSSLTDGTPSAVLQVIEVPMDPEQASRVVLEKPIQGACAVKLYARQDGLQICLLELGSDQGVNRSAFTVYQVRPESETPEEILRYQASDLMVYNFFPENGSALLFAGIRNGIAVVERLTNGKSEKLIDFPDTDGGLWSPQLTPEAGFAFQRNKDGTYRLWVQTLSGETLYKGEWTPDPRTHTEGEALQLAVDFQGGDQHAFYAFIHDLNGSGISLFRYDLTDGSLKGKLIWEE